jgi:ATP-dependent protease Clp ATPase subunit
MLLRSVIGRQLLCTAIDVRVLTVRVVRYCYLCVSTGLIPEFIGRIPTIVSTTALTKDELIQVCACSLYTFH